jgi:hypothetical protein
MCFCFQRKKAVRVRHRPPVLMIDPAESSIFSGIFICSKRCNVVCNILLVYALFFGSVFPGKAGNGNKMGFLYFF